MLKDAFAANTAACNLADLTRDSFNATYILSFKAEDGTASPEKMQRAENYLRNAVISMEKQLADLKTAIG